MAREQKVSIEASQVADWLEEAAPHVRCGNVTALEFDWAAGTGVLNVSFTPKYPVSKLSSLSISITEPRWKYDCNNCKFKWNCGPLCNCVLRDAKEPPEDRRLEVERMQAEWREKKGL